MRRAALALLCLAGCGVAVEEYTRKDDEARAYRRAYEAAEESRALLAQQADALSELAARVAGLERALEESRARSSALEVEMRLMAQTLGRMRDAGSDSR